VPGESLPTLLEPGPGRIARAQARNRPDHLQHLLHLRRVDRLQDPARGQRRARLVDFAADCLAHFPGVLDQLLDPVDLPALPPPLDVTAAPPLAQVLRVDRPSRPETGQHLAHRRLGIEPLEDLRTAPAVVEPAVELGAKPERQTGDLALARDVQFIGHTRGQRRNSFHARRVRLPRRRCLGVLRDGWFLFEIPSS
jgi:hypothetical protein